MNVPGEPQDPMPDKADPVEAAADQDVPREREQEVELSLNEIEQLALIEASKQSALRGPIELTEIARDGKVPKVWYRRLTPVQTAALTERHGGKGLTEKYVIIFVERCLNKDGKRIFNDAMIQKMMASWNLLMIERVVNEIMSGSLTQLTDADLGN